MSMFESEAKAYMNIFFFFKSNQMLNLINKIVWLILHLGGGGGGGGGGGLCSDWYMVYL